MFEWLKSWDYSNIKILLFLIIILKKSNLNNKLLFYLSNSKKIFYYNYLNLFKKINDIVIDNIIINNYNKFKYINIIKLEIIKILLTKNTVFKYKKEINNLKKYKFIIFVLNNKIFWKKKKLIILILIILIKIKFSNLIISKNKNLEIKYLICGKILKNLNILYIQQIENLILWVMDSLVYILNIFFIYY
ncbi:hypothetical protein ASU29_028 [Candidatus Nasuia deltocephalinicola]|uniref:Uncharacterized protein n=1 Tax=Candidatus Nasuia deltocephalincola TaxID=1160784 RepID=A0A0S2UP59_9PROT|nr:hypothetical protein ASU29_028 [Candidatus Nasuia deltocephalinicola]